MHGNKRTRRALDMTMGKPSALLCAFAGPAMLSGVLQMLYTFCDGVIVSRLLGADAFAAIGASANLNWFPLSMLLGASQGFGVLMSRREGARDEAGFGRALAMGVMLSLALAALFTLVGLTCMTALLRALSTPETLMSGASAYLLTLWAGMAFTVLYNVLAAALRAMGDSRTPLAALVISTGVNIALDVAFMCGLGMGVEGAALATIAAQALSAVYCAARICKARGLTGKMWRPDGETLRALVKLGLPPMLSNGVIAAGGFFVQKAINACGVAFVTGISAAKRYFELLILCGSALEGAVATFVGQNIGAKLTLRAKDGVATALKLGCAAAAAALILRRQWKKLTVKDSGRAELVNEGETKHAEEL